jgi:hypothetical protein
MRQMQVLGKVLIPSLTLTRAGKEKKVTLAKAVALLYNRQAVQTT